MEPGLEVFNWERVFLGLAPPTYLLEIALKAVFIFLILMIVMRLIGKRGQQDISPMQQILMIALGSAAGDAMLYPEISLSYAVLILIGVTLLTVALEWLAGRSRPVRDYLESRPRVLVKDGVVDYDALRKERTTRRELFSELRMKGASSLSQVDVAILEITGDVSVFLNDRQPTDKDLVDYILADERSSPPAAGGDTRDHANG